MTDNSWNTDKPELMLTIALMCVCAWVIVGLIAGAAYALG